MSAQESMVFRRILMGDKFLRLRDNVWIKKCIFILSRTITLYLIGFLLIITIFEGQKVFKRARMKALNRIRPASFDYLLDVVEKGHLVDKEKLGEFRFYYKKVTHYLPNIAEAYGMLGFCYYYLGDDKKAISAYKKAISLEPNFLAFHYNLGVIYFRKKDYESAVESLKKAVETNLKKYLDFVSSSRIYFTFLGDAQHVNRMLKLRARDTFLNSYKLLVLSNYHLNNFPELVRYSKEAIRLSFPEPEFFFYSLGRISYKFGKYKDASEFFQIALKREPKNADIAHYLGLSLKALGKEVEGEELLRRATLLSGMKPSSVWVEGEINVRIF